MPAARSNKGMSANVSTTVNHWYLPPNWLGRLTGADGEGALDAAYLSLYIGTTVLGFGVWKIRQFLTGSPH
jgi:hypothetical protein